MRVSWNRIAVRTVIGLMLCTVAIAQVERRSGGEQQKLMQQYQQIAAEKTALQSQLAAAKKDLDTARAELAAAKKERDQFKARAGGAAAAAAEAAQLNAARTALEKNLELYKRRQSELVERYRETATNLKEVEADRAQMRRDLAARSAEFDKCARANAELYQVSSEVLDRYEHVGVFTRVGASEPFTRLTRTRIQNLADEYRERARENALHKDGATPAAAPAAETPAAAR